MDNFEFLRLNLPKNRFWAPNIKNLSLNSKSAWLIYYGHKVSEKTINFEFLSLSLPKKGFSLRNFKNISLDSESASLRYYEHQFSDKTEKSEVLRPNLPKNGCQGRDIKVWVWIWNQQPWGTTYNNSYTKKTILIFWAQICQTMKFGVAISKI